MKVRSAIIWDKVIHGLADLQTCYAPQYEIILFASKGRSILLGSRPKDIIRCQRLSPSKMKHPYQKPVELIVPLLRVSTQVGNTILDPFTGSGTVGVACI